MANKEDRAKQFLPFDAVKGLQDALREKEIEYDEERNLLEDSLMELEKIFNKIEIGTTIKVKYYKNKRYVISKAVVTKIDRIKKKITL